MKSVAYRMNKARAEVMMALNKTMVENELPAYIMESVVGDIVGELRKSATNELLNEMERENGDMEQSIHQKKLAE